VRRTGRIWEGERFSARKKESGIGSIVWVLKREAGSETGIGGKGLGVLELGAGGGFWSFKTGRMGRDFQFGRMDGFEGKCLDWHGLRGREDVAFNVI
jgi:hypothetical protein